MERGEELPNGALPRSAINESSASLNLQHHGESEGSDDENQQVANSHPKLRLVVRTAIGLLLFGVVLACVTFSKLTLIRLTDELRDLTKDANITSKEVSLHKRAVCWRLVNNSTRGLQIFTVRSFC